MRALALVVAIAACGHPAQRHAAAPIAAGMQIALYDDGSGKSYAAVDDRRWIDVSGDHVILPLDPRAVFASLAIETLAGGDLRIEECTREALPQPASADTADETPLIVTQFVPAVECRTHGAPGRYLVRMFYVTPRLAYRAQHEVILDGERANVSSRFTIDTPRWGGRAEVVLFDGVPGADEPPREVVRGEIALDGSSTTLSLPPQHVTPTLRRIYDGAIRLDGVADTDPGWGATSQSSVWVWIELPGVHLAPGPVRVQLSATDTEVSYVDVPAIARVQNERVLRLPLWIDSTLRGLRQRLLDGRTNAPLAERVNVTLINSGDAPAEVFVDEHVRTMPHRRVEHAWPVRPTFTGEVLRTKLVVPPGKTARCGYTIAYDE